MTDDLMKRLRYWGERPGPHRRTIVDAAEEIERLRELLNAWTELAREYLDTELAGRTFAALRDANHG